ncbi:MAG: hypothetical protein H6659_18665 [Ardenticatenaceae bacterium]|nr:hypothetical protein [Anaerolineales bacterium]MCB8985858.1 hypothetical protein [Ardenticatenaceae bacterium]
MAKPMQMQVRWVRPPSELAKAVEKYGDRVFVAILAVAQHIATQAQNDMRRNASWTDRTGNARNGLFSTANRAARDVVVLYLSHGTAIWYGVFLETRYAGKYAIIIPTMQRILPQLEKMLKDLFK